MLFRSRASFGIAACLIVAAVTAVAWAEDAGKDRPPFTVQTTADGKVIVGGRVFDSWQDYTLSEFFQANGMRCGMQAHMPNNAPLSGSPSDCAMYSTNPADGYDPSVVKYRIPVVVHVIMHTNGDGYISEAMVQSQIDILNEDYLALPGTNGRYGTDVQVEFYLATEDPAGDPTNGITYSTNNTWFNDGGAYYNTLAWDPNRYLNIYTNSAGGYLGYVPNLPQGGIVGSNADRVVILWSAFGRNAPIGYPYNQGRTATHEVGHYLGLWHPFDNGCGSDSACYTTGDAICDTPGEAQPRYGCPTTATSCGTPDPVRNYMDYTDDLCMREFTPEQSRRIRCTLEHYRPDLIEIVSPLPCPGDLDGDGFRNVTDFGLFANAYGSGLGDANYNPDADLDGSGRVNVTDFSLFATVFGVPCP